MDVSQPLRQTWPRERPGAAMCVQDVDVQCVLQFTLSNAASCALHRLASRVIHRSEVFQFAFYGALSESPQLKALRKKGGPKRFCTRPGGSNTPASHPTFTEQPLLSNGCRAQASSQSGSPGPVRGQRRRKKKAHSDHDQQPTPIDGSRLPGWVPISL